MNERHERLGDWTFDEFRYAVAELVMAALVGQNATLVCNPDSRADILSRGAMLAAQVVEPLWTALCDAPWVAPEREVVRVSTAARCLGAILAGRPSVITATAEHRQGVIDQSVVLAVAAAESLLAALGE